MEINTPRAINDLTSAMAYVVDVLNEKENLYHAWRVSIFASEFAKVILPEEKKNIFYASLLHDIGYLALPNHVSHYLSIREDPNRDLIVLSHPIIGAQITSQIPTLSIIAKLILTHHEWYNGKGYPLGRQRNEIPMAAQIILLADQFDLTLRFDPVHSARDLEKVVLSWSNKMAPSALVEAALSVSRQKEFLLMIHTDKKMITDLFNKAKSETGQIAIAANVDAVGATCEVFSQLIDTKHPCMIGHSKRVSLHSLLIALAMNLPHDEITRIKWAALLHDVGKLGISRSLINKPASLLPREFETVKLHSIFTRELLETVTDFKDIALIASSDHERCDGKGYPQGLKGEAIPIGSRIISIADAFDAMTSNRPYKKAMSIGEACKEIQKNSGSQFSPVVVKEAIPVLRNLYV